jgi:hypothetical protein
MASRNATVAEAVKTALNTAAASAGTFGETFVAKRVYAPGDALEDTKALTVSIWAPGDAKSQAGRGVFAYEIPVLVAMAKRLTAACDPSDENANDELDALMLLAEKVADFFAPDPAGVGGAQWQTTELNLANPDAMRERRQFFAVATLHFLMHV